jgi:hypothetical protein
MDLVAIEDTFQQWMRALESQGISATLARSFDSTCEGLLVTIALTNVRIDPEGRARISNRRRARSHPLARMQYIVAVSGAADPVQAEQVLLCLLLEADQHPAIKLLSDPVPSAWWLAQALAPRPAFQFEACITEEISGSTAPPIHDHSVDMNSL